MDVSDERESVNVLLHSITLQDTFDIDTCAREYYELRDERRSARDADTIGYGYDRASRTGEMVREFCESRWLREAGGRLSDGRRMHATQRALAALAVVRVNSSGAL